jgi:hypothetical protein
MYICKDNFRLILEKLYVGCVLDSSNRGNDPGVVCYENRIELSDSTEDGKTIHISRRTLFYAITHSCIAAHNEPSWLQLTSKARDCER